MLPARAVKNQGTLVICGGGRLPEAVYDEFVRLAGGKSARLVHIPSAHQFTSMRAIRSRYSGWLDLKVRSIDFLDADTSEEANTDEFIKPLEKATGVWIGGGYQGRLVSLYRGTKVESALRGVLERGGVIGGTSAGAAVLSKTMIRYSQASEAVVDRGFDLLRGAVVDQHFSQRGRHTRLVGVLNDHPQLVGLGVDEGTALVVQGNHLRVLGKSQATVMIPTPTGQPTLLFSLRAGETAHLKSSSQPHHRWLAVERKQ